MSNPETMIQGTDLALPLANPFTLSTAVWALGQADVPIEGLCIAPERELLHIAVSRELAHKARRELEAAGLSVSEERKVIILEMPQGPERWFDRFRRLANAELKVDLLYVATNNRLVLGIQSGSTVVVLLAETLEGKRFTLTDFYDRITWIPRAEHADASR